ncbi:MAG: RNA polymerase subunit sigma, partial [Planctomycetaceae bacterium]|nr:RNA polymerase subunit sigma [Planctomycetaceae bacterium]
MNDVTRILAAVESGTPGATDELFPLVYEELRSIARRQLATEQPGATLQATALVHEAYLRLVGNGNDSSWSHRGHFFGAAAQAMRRILVDVARQKAAQKRNDRRERQELKESSIAAPMRPEYVLAVDEALDRLEATHPEAARLVQLRY